MVLCTGYSRNFNESDAAALGIREYLTKPVGLKDLALTVRKYIRPGEVFSGPIESIKACDNG